MLRNTSMYAVAGQLKMRRLEYRIAPMTTPPSRAPTMMMALSWPVTRRPSAKLFQYWGISPHRHLNSGIVAASSYNLAASMRASMYRTANDAMVSITK